MKVLPIAADSLGVRSMATLITAAGGSLLIDPGATVAEERFGLGPTNVERGTYTRAAAQVVEAAHRADALLVTSYRHGHFNLLPDAPLGAPLYAKIPRLLTEHRESRRVFPLVGSEQRPIMLVDEMQFRLSGMEVRCSPPLQRTRDGDQEDTAFAVTARGDGRTFVFVSDVGWPLSLEVRHYLLTQQPDLLYLSGPDLTDAVQYPLMRLQTRPPWLVDALSDIKTLLESTGCRIILDHGIVRDVRYPSYFREAFDNARVMTAAEFRGMPINLLEARRQELTIREGRSTRQSAVGARR